MRSSIFQSGSGPISWACSETVGRCAREINSCFDPGQSCFSASISQFLLMKNQVHRVHREAGKQRRLAWNKMTLYYIISCHNLNHFSTNLRWFPHNIRAIMAKIKLPKNPHSMVIFWIKVTRSYRDLLALKLTPREKIELEVKHISLKADVSR